jgi:hypothetical protein
MKLIKLSGCKEVWHADSSWNSEVIQIKTKPDKTELRRPHTVHKPVNGVLKYRELKQNRGIRLSECFSERGWNVEREYRCLLWDMMPCSLIDVYRHLWRTCCVHLQGWRINTR